MPRADELEHNDRVRLPDWAGGEIVVVDHVTVFTNRAKIYWKRYGERGSITLTPQAELEDCT